MTTMTTTEVLSETKSIYVPPETPDSPFGPPYRNDTYIEHPLVQLQPSSRMRLKADVQTMHQEALMKLVEKVSSCPEPVPLLVTRNCPPNHTEELRSSRIHAVVQLLSQIREYQHQALVRKVYKIYGPDHRKAAKELYAREQFTAAYVQYWSLFTCLSCDKCRQLSAPERHNLTVDLLEKLAVTCLRSGWLEDAERFSAEALQHEKCSTRARMWLATAQLGLGKLEKARKNLMMLPRRGQFPSGFPPWIESRVHVQREILTRLEQEARGGYDIIALELDPPDRTPDTPHSTALIRIEATPVGYRTTARIAKDALLLVAAPVACAPCYTDEPPAEPAPQADPKPLQAEKQTSPAQSLTLPVHDEDPSSLFSLALIADSVFEQAKEHSQAQTLTASPIRQKTLHDEDPSLLSLAVIADTVYTQAKALAHVGVSVRAAAARCSIESERVIDLVSNDLLAAAIVVAQNYTLSIPHAHSDARPRETGGLTDESGPGTDKTSEKAVHAGHALYLPALKLLTSKSANTYATYHGPYLFLRAARDLSKGSLLTFSGFPGNVGPPRGGTPSRARVPALASTPSTSKASSRGLNPSSPRTPSSP